MSHFRGVMQAHEKKLTLHGSKDSGLKLTGSTREVELVVHLYYENGKDHFAVTATQVSRTELKFQPKCLAAGTIEDGMVLED